MGFISDYLERLSLGEGASDYIIDEDQDYDINLWWYLFFRGRNTQFEEVDLSILEEEEEDGYI